MRQVIQPPIADVQFAPTRRLNFVIKFYWSPRLVVPPNLHCPPIVTVAIGAATGGGAAAISLCRHSKGIPDSLIAEMSII